MTNIGKPIGEFVHEGKVGALKIRAKKVEVQLNELCRMAAELDHRVEISGNFDLERNTSVNLEIVKGRI